MAKSDDDEDDDKYEPILMMSNDSLAAGDDHTGFPAKCSLFQWTSGPMPNVWPMRVHIFAMSTIHDKIEDYMMQYHTLICHVQVPDKNFTQIATSTTEVKRV